MHFEGLQPPPRTDFVHELGVIPFPDDVDEEFDCNDDDDDDINNPLFWDEAAWYILVNDLFETDKYVIGINNDKRFKVTIAEIYNPLIY